MASTCTQSERAKGRHSKVPARTGTGGRKHGYLNPDGAHMGDLMNLQVGADGRASATLHVADDMADA
jgi:Cu/Zn superoxide dismutase